MRIVRPVCCFWLGLLLATLVSGQAAPGLRSGWESRYLNQTLFLKMPVPADSLKVQVTGGHFQVLGDRNAPALFLVGQQIRISDLDFGSRHIEFKIVSIDQRQDSKIRFQFDGGIDASFNAVLDKFFTSSLDYREVEDAKRDFLKGHYLQFVESSASLTRLTPQQVQEIYARTNPVSVGVWEDLQGLQSRLQEQNQSIASLIREKTALEAKLKGLQQQAMDLVTTGKDAKEKLRGLQTSESDLKKQLGQKHQELESLQRSIRAACTEMGLAPSASLSPAELLQKLSQTYLQLHAGTQAYQARIKQMTEALETAAASQQSLEEQLARSGQEQADLKQQIEILSTQDKDLAGQMLQLQQLKNVIQSKLLSKSLLKVRTERRKTASEQVIEARLSLKEIPLGSLVITAPIEISPGQTMRLTLENRLKTGRDLAKIQDPDLQTLLQNLREFPQMKVSIEHRSPHFELKEIQSPERDNTNLFVWEIIPKAGQDVDLIFQFQSRIENDTLPILELPLSVPYPTVERTIVQYLQPVPLGIGIAAGLLLALPFFLIHRRKSPPAPPPPAQSATKSRHFGNKEL